MRTLVIVLAAGEGKDMHSFVNPSSKLSFCILDKPMLCYVQKRIHEISFDDEIYIIGYQAEQIKKMMGSESKFIYQKTLNGTYAALMLAKEFFYDYDDVVVIYGSMPLFSKDSLLQMMDQHRHNQNDITYVEGIFIFKSCILCEHLKSDYTSCVEIKQWIDLMKKDGKNVQKIELSDADETLIVKNRLDLAKANKIMQQKVNRMHMINGITIVDPNTTYIGEDVKIGNDTIVYPNTYIYGKSMIGVSCELGPNTTIIDSFIDNGAILSNCIVKHQTVAKKS